MNSPACLQGGRTPRKAASEHRCFTRARAVRLLVASVFCVAATPLGGCDSGIEFGDDPAAVTSLGPVYASDTEAIIWFTTWDAEADSVDVELQVSTGGDFAGVDASTMGPRQTSGLTGGRREHARHAITWRFAESGVAVDTEVRLRLVAVGQNRPLAEWGPAPLSSTTDSVIP